MLTFRNKFRVCASRQAVSKLTGWKKQQELPLATMYVQPITVCVTICDYHDEKKKRKKKKKFIPIYNADCFASA